VFVEKPLARSVDDGRAIVASSAAAGTVCAVGYQWRAVGALRALDEDLAASPVRSMTSVGVGPSQRRPWFEDGRQSAGLIGERASHHIDLQRRIAGHVVSVQAVDVAVGTSVAGVDDRSVALLLRYASGAVGTVQVTEVDEGHPVLHRTDIVSAADSHELRLDPEFTLERGGAARAREPADGWRPFERQMVAFLAAVAGEADAGVACTAREALGTLEVVVAAEAAVRTGATVVVCGAGG
jgi:predicted dehydrogenase